MKKLIFTMILLTILAFMADIGMKKEDERAMPVKFQEAMNYITFNTYVDKDFGYTFTYPPFFKESNEPWYGIGHVKFSYHENETNMNLECRVLPKSAIPCKDSHFIISEPLQNFNGYINLSHGVLHENRWYVLSFCYPKEYHKAASRIIWRVKSWNPKPFAVQNTHFSKKK